MVDEGVEAVGEAGGVGSDVGASAELEGWTTTGGVAAGGVDDAAAAGGAVAGGVDDAATSGGVAVVGVGDVVAAGGVMPCHGDDTAAAGGVGDAGDAAAGVVVAGAVEGAGGCAGSPDIGSMTMGVPWRRAGARGRLDRMGTKSTAGDGSGSAAAGELEHDFSWKGNTVSSK